MNKWGVLGFVFGVLCIAAVAGILFLASRDVTVNDVVGQPAREEVDMDEVAAPATPLPTQTTPAATPTAGDATVNMTRTVTDYAPGQPVDVTVTLSKEGPGEVRAMGLTEVIPPAWTFEGLVSDTRPDINRPVGQRIEFAWFKIPEFPHTFTYRVIAQDTSGPQPIEGEALWRTDGPEMRTGTVSTTVEPGTPSVAETPAAAPVAPPAAPPSLPASSAAAAQGSDVGQPLPVEVVVEEGAAAAAPTQAPAETPPAALDIPIAIEDAPAAPADAPPVPEIEQKAMPAPTPPAEAAPEAAAEEAAEEAATAEPADAAEPAAAEADAAAAKPADGEAGGIAMSRAVAGDAYTPGQPVTVEMTLTHEGNEPVTALAVTEDLPENWAFAGVVGGDAPTVAPQPRATGTLSFIWVNVPQFPFTFTYLVDTTENPGGPATLTGKALYRKLGPELQTETVSTELTPVAQEAPAAAQPVEVVVEDEAE